MTPLAPTRPMLRQLALGVVAACALQAGAAFAQSTSPVVLTFSTVGDSRQDPVSWDQASVGATLSGQDAIWLQSTKAFARILRGIQSQKASMLFFNGDMIHGYGWAGFGYTSNTAGTAITGPVAPASVADIVGSDLFKTYQQYGFWRGMVAPVMETGTYVFPVPGNHETQCKACGKKSKVENEAAWNANMGDLIVDSSRFTSLLGSAPQNVANGPVAGQSTDGLTTDQSRLSYSFDFKGVHFAVINTDPVGQDTHAPTNWLAADLAAARARGARRIFVFGHKPAYAYSYLINPATNTVVTSSSGLDSAPGTAAARDAFWNVIEQYGATYFAGHEHILNVQQPKGGAWQVMVGSGGSPFEAKATDKTLNPATDRTYAWATVKVRADATADIQIWGFDANMDASATRLIKTITLN